MGWRFDLAFPDSAKFVVVVAPHTSDWDFVIVILTIVTLGIRTSWMGKHALFRWPFGGLLRWLGGIPIDRRASHGVVETMVDRFQRRPQLVLGIAPEGTRRKVGSWKTGFYHIALGAGVPIVPCYIDYARKVIGSGATLQPCGDLEADLLRLRSVYDGIRGKHRSGAAG